MNNLSWMLYLAAVLPTFATAIAVVITILFICVVLVSLVYASVEEQFPPFVLKLKWWFLSLMVIGLCTNLVPDKNTFYLIAGSEMGGKAVETPEFQKVRQVVNEFLDEQLDDKGKK